MKPASAPSYRAARLVARGQPLVDARLPATAPAAGEVVVGVRAAGICHSDAHYRAGIASARLPCTLGHEVAGVVLEAGAEVTDLAPGDRVCLHYLVTCGRCRWCRGGEEQFCAEGEMLGKHRDGGFAERVTVPARNAQRLPDAIPFEHGAVLMCSSATALHALRKARLGRGERVAVFGVGGLGVSAIQLALALGAGEVFAVDVHDARLALAGRLGARPVDGRADDAAAQLRRLTGGSGVDVALELVGAPRTMEQAVESLAVHGRAALAGLTDEPMRVHAYRDLLCREAEVIGVSDHLATEIPELLRFVEQGALDLSCVVTQRVPLEAAAIDAVLDGLEGSREGVRSVVVP